MENIAQTLTPEQPITETEGQTIMPLVDSNAELDENGFPIFMIPEIEIKDKFFEATDDDSYVIAKLNKHGVRLETPDGKLGKNVSYTSFAKTMLDSASLDTGYLPLLGAKYIGVRRYMQFKNKHAIFVEATPTIRAVEYDRKNGDPYQKFSVPFPGLLMAIIMTENTDGRLVHHNTKIYATVGPVINDSTDLYKFPFTNVYDDNHICWGDIKINMPMTVLQAGSLMDTFVTSIFNNDLFRASTTPYKSATNLESVLKDLATKTTYPYDTLSKAITMGSLISQIKNN